MTGFYRGSPSIGRRRPSSHACRSLVWLMTTLCPPFFSAGNKMPWSVSIHAESTGVTGVFGMRPVLEGSGRDADPCQRQLLGPSVLANMRGSAPPARLPHRLPSLNRVVPQHPPPSHRLRRAGRNVAVGPDSDPLRVDRRRIGLEVTKLLLLLGIQPPLTTSISGAS